MEEYVAVLALGEGSQGEDRVFGLLYLTQNDADERRVERYVEAFDEEGVDIVETGEFPLDPGRAQELATGIIARMKEAGVTTVIARADPITLPAFTREATKQGWYPEWVIGGFQFTDTSTFATVATERDPRRGVLDRCAREAAD